MIYHTEKKNNFKIIERVSKKKKKIVNVLTKCG